MTLEDQAKHLIDTTRYMALGTADPDGRPRVSPVYYAPDGYSTLYWISSLEARHSRNIAERPEISMVIYDSAAPIGAGRAVYLLATAERLPDDEYDRYAAMACRARFPEQQDFPLAPPARPSRCASTGPTSPNTPCTSGAATRTTARGSTPGSS